MVYPLRGLLPLKQKMAGIGETVEQCKTSQITGGNQRGVAGNQFGHSSKLHTELRTTQLSWPHVHKSGQQGPSGCSHPQGHRAAGREKPHGGE